MKICSQKPRHDQKTGSAVSGVVGAGQGTRASARRKRFHPLTAPARHDRAMLVGTKGVPTVSTTPPAGRTTGCQKNLPKDPGLENGRSRRSSRLRKLTVATRGF